MTPPKDPDLDAEELLHLAIAASQRGQSAETITLLKRALALAPNDARSHYLLGAEHAQIGLYERAIEEMRRAVELDGNLDTAHFQLGLLYFTSGRVEAAARAWKALDKLDPSNALHLFKTGLLHLANDELAECEACLRRGIAANRANAALNRDMTRLLGEVRSRLGVPPDTASAATGDAQSPETPRPADVLLSAYRKNKPEETEH